MASRKRRPPRKTQPKAQGAGPGSPILVWIGLSTVALVGLALIWLTAIYPGRPGPGAGRDVELAFLGDESITAIASRLESAGLVADPRIFAMYARFSVSGKPVRGT